jgi:hypothetical protein
MERLLAAGTPDGSTIRQVAASFDRNKAQERAAEKNVALHKSKLE